MKKQATIAVRALRSVRNVTTAVVSTPSPWADPQLTFQPFAAAQTPYPLHLCPYGARRAA